MSVAKVEPMPFGGRRIGGSDIPKLLGISKYGDVLDVYERIVNNKQSEWSPVMERGAAVEPELRAYGQRALNIELLDFDSDYHLHPIHDFAGCQIDDVGRREGTQLVLEYKSQSQYAKGWGSDGSDQIPEQYRAQVAWQLACADLELAFVIVGFGTDAPAPRLFDLANVVHYEIQRDGLYESHILQVAGDFWRAHVLPRVPPTTKRKGSKRT